MENNLNIESIMDKNIGESFIIYKSETPLQNAYKSRTLYFSEQDIYKFLSIIKNINPDGIYFYKGMYSEGFGKNICNYDSTQVGFVKEKIFHLFEIRSKVSNEKALIKQKGEHYLVINSKDEILKDILDYIESEGVEQPDNEHKVSQFSYYFFNSYWKEKNVSELEGNVETEKKLKEIEDDFKEYLINKIHNENQLIINKLFNTDDDQIIRYVIEQVEDEVKDYSKDKYIVHQTFHQILNDYFEELLGRNIWDGKVQLKKSKIESFLNNYFDQETEKAKIRKENKEVELLLDKCIQWIRLNNISKITYALIDEFLSSNEVRIKGEQKSRLYNKIKDKGY